MPQQCKKTMLPNTRRKCKVVPECSENDAANIRRRFTDLMKNKQDFQPDASTNELINDCKSINGIVNIMDMVNGDIPNSNTNGSNSNQENEGDVLDNGSCEVIFNIEPNAEVMNFEENLINEELNIEQKFVVNPSDMDCNMTPEGLLFEEESNTNLNFITKEEPQQLDYIEFNSTQLLTSNFEVDNQHLNTGDNVMDECFLTNTLVSRASRKIIRSIAKQVQQFKSPEYLWCMSLLSLKLDHKKAIQQIIQKIVSDDAKESINELLEPTKSFTAAEYDELFKKLRNRETKEFPPECEKVFKITIMWFKTKLEKDLESVVSRPDIYNSYSDYCKAQNIEPLKTGKFTKLLKTIYPLVTYVGVKHNCYLGLKRRVGLHTPKLPKYAQDQLHKNLLLSQYMSCHNCCSLYSSLILNKQPYVANPKVDAQGFQCKSVSDSTDLPPIIVHDPLDILEATTDRPKKKKSNSLQVIKQVAKKSVFSKHTKGKHKLTTTSVPEHFIVNGNNPEDIKSSQYLNKLRIISERLNRFIITKTDNNLQYKVLCTCCQDVFFVSESHGEKLIATKEKLFNFYENSEYVSKEFEYRHPTVKFLYYRYGDLKLPANVVHENINPQVSLNRFEVYDWFKNEITTLKHKLLETALNALSSNSRRNSYQNKAFLTASGIISHTPPQLTLPQEPIYISAVRETPKEKSKSDVSKVAEVFIKTDIDSGLADSKKRRICNEENAVVLAPAKKSKTNSTSSVTALAHKKTSSRRKEIEYIYFPSMDGSTNNLRLTNLDTLFKCVLCLMLFNTEQKLADHEKTHLFCRKCNRKLRDVEIMRQHLMKHCERNYKKDKPILKIHKIDSIDIMIRRYGEIFQICKEYYKPKKKYKEMKKPKIEVVNEALLIQEEPLDIEIKPNIQFLPAETVPIDSCDDYTHAPLIFVEVKPEETILNIPNTTEMPTLNIATANEVCVPQTETNYINEPPKLVPISYNRLNNDDFPKRTVKIRIKDLTELS